MEGIVETGEKLQRRRIVQATAVRLRDIILAQPPDTLIGSLPELAQRLQVGIATVQQVARILEHEGLLTVRRGPGGGYYGMRPDGAALERSIAAYLQVHPSAYHEVIEMTSMLDSELAPVAAQSSDLSLRKELRALLTRVAGADAPEERMAIEEAYRDIVFKMVNRPLMKLLVHVTAQVARSQPFPVIFAGAEGIAAWKFARQRILQAILDGDEDLARFETVRHRRDLLEKLRLALDKT